MQPLTPAPLPRDDITEHAGAENTAGWVREPIGTVKTRGRCDVNEALEEWAKTVLRCPPNPVAERAPRVAPWNPL